MRYSVGLKKGRQPKYVKVWTEDTARLLEATLGEPRLWRSVSSDDLLPLAESDNATLRKVAVLAAGIIPDVPQVKCEPRPYINARAEVTVQGVESDAAGSEEVAP